MEVHDLSRAFGSFVAVDKISLRVAKGEIFGFLGPNGAGKSTTIRMLCGLLMPTGGGGTVGGYDIRTEPEAVKKIIGYMSQKFSLYDDLTVEENIDFFGGVYGVPKEKKGRAQGLGPGDGRDRGQERGPDGDARHGFQATPRPRLRRPSRASRPLPGRADVRRRPPVAAQFLGPHTGDGRFGHHYLRHHPLHGRSRLLRQAGPDLQGQHRRGRGAHGAAAGVHEAGDPGNRDGRGRSRPSRYCSRTASRAPSSAAPSMRRWKMQPYPPNA